ncbi:MAG: 4Fe-4S binding protein [Dehalococcoidia bacterium]
MSRRTLFTLPPLSYVSVPTINQSQCRAEDGCDQCVSACPQRALEKDASTILVSRVQCQSCGSCVAACPQRAVELPGWSAEEREAQLSSLLESEPRQGTRAVAFVCQNAANLAGAGWLPVRIPCTSSVSASELLTSLAHGANRVAVYSCGAMCATGLNEAVRGRVSYCQELLRVLGDTSATERVQFLNPDDGGSAKPVTLLPTLPGETPNNPMNLFGNGAAAKAVIELTARYGAQSLTLEHPHSPLGLVGIDASTCTGCDTCVVACPTGALFSERSDQGPTINFDPALCIGCGKCVTSCPEQAADAIDMSPTTDLLQISQGPKSLFQGREVRCRRCEAPVATREMLNRIATLLGDEYIPEYMEKLCVDCRGRS